MLPLRLGTPFCAPGGPALFRTGLPVGENLRAFKPPTFQGGLKSSEKFVEVCKKMEGVGTPTPLHISEGIFPSGTPRGPSGPLPDFIRGARIVGKVTIHMNRSSRKGFYWKAMDTSNFWTRSGGL